MDDLKNFDGNGEFIGGNSTENKVKINFENIESTESGFVQNERFGVAEEYEMASAPATPAYEVPEQPVMMNNEFAAPAQDPYQQPAPAPAPVPQQMPAQPQKPKKAKKVVDPEVKKAKKAKNKKRFGVFIRVFVITVLSIATLWTVMYTIDHTLAAQGIPPFFKLPNIEIGDHEIVGERKYTVSYIDSEDPGAWSYECLGYRIQFVFDENGQLKQECLWAWEKEGPNDILQQRGILFEISDEEAKTSEDNTK